MEKFGTDRELQEKYAHHHRNDGCAGVWLKTQVAMPYRIEEGLFVVIHNAPVVKCDKCEAMYFEEGFEENFLEHFARRIVLTNRRLMKPEIKFLRIYIGYTQEKIANDLSISKSEVSKFESTKDTKDQRIMDDSLMVRFKLLVADILGLTIPPGAHLWKIDRVSHATSQVSQVIDAADIKQIAVS